MIRPEDVQWFLCRMARRELEIVRTRLGDQGFDAWLLSLKQFLCGYFSANENCAAKQGQSISPIRARVDRGKGLKARYAFPGCGKRGGMRLAILAFCAERIVKIAGAWQRKDDPDDAEFDAAFRHAD